MSYYDSNSNFVRPAKDEDVIAWYRDKPAPFADILTPLRTARGFWSRFDCYEQQELVRSRQKLKKHVLEAVKLNSGMRGPHNASIVEGWLKQCRLKRIMIVATQKDMLVNDYEKRKRIKEYKEQHARLIHCIRVARFSAGQWTPLCRHKVYVEPNCNFVHYEELQQAQRALDVTFHPVVATMTHRLFLRLEKRFKKSGRITGYWSAQWDMDDDPNAEIIKDEEKRCCFWFSDPAEIEKLTEELVWIKMRF